MSDGMGVGLAVMRDPQGGRAEVLFEFSGKQVSTIYGRHFFHDSESLLAVQEIIGS